MMAAENARISLSSFLIGPEREHDGESLEDLLEIDDIFGKNLDDILADAARWDPDSLMLDATTPETCAIADPAYRFRPVAGGILLIAPSQEIAGAYLGPDVSISRPHRGRGLGAELIVERYLRDQSLPTWHLDEPAYSYAGLAAHEAAWRLLQDARYLERKCADLAENNPPSDNRQPNDRQRKEEPAP